jgi:hypothetical protein
MRRVYDVFEKFPDRSTLWRATITGRFEAERKLQELTESSGNEFFLIDIQAGQQFSINSLRANPRPLVKSTTAR